MPPATVPPRTPARPSRPTGATDWHAQELLLMREVMRLVGRSLAPGRVLREMLQLMSELLSDEPTSLPLTLMNPDRFR